KMVTAYSSSGLSGPESDGSALLGISPVGDLPRFLSLIRIPLRQPLSERRRQKRLRALRDGRGAATPATGVARARLVKGPSLRFASSPLQFSRSICSASWEGSGDPTGPGPVGASRCLIILVTHRGRRRPASP